MTLYEQVHSQLFVNGSCKCDVWLPVHLVHDDDGRKVDCLACYPSRGFIKLAIKTKRGYQGFRFNRKRELVDDGIWLSLAGQQMEGSTI